VKAKTHITVPRARNGDKQISLHMPSQGRAVVARRRTQSPQAA